ncbi:MAG: hypothetical protein IJ400_00750 [Clostridia bacterium]|nr:hypothetical protein [Clostridia bacterium]
MTKRTLITLLAVVMVLVSVFAFVSCNKDDLSLKPTNVAYDGVRLTWQRVELAEYYTISINGGEEQRVNTNRYNFECSEEFDVVVNSVVNGKTYGDTHHFTPLDPIEALYVAEDGTITWDPISQATGYRVSVNGKVLDTDLTIEEYKPEPGSNRIKIRPVVSGDDSYYSVWSEEKQVYVNTTPSNIKYDGEFLTWLGNASTYEITANGTTETVQGNKHQFFADGHDFTVEIKALGDHVATFDSGVASETFYYLKPATDFAVENGILLWTPVESADGYTIRINGAIQGDKVTEAKYENLVAGKSLEVEVLPYKNEGKFFSSWSEKQTIFLLDAPTTSWNADLELDGEANNNLVWDLVSGAVGYVVEIEKDGVVLVNETLPSTQMAFGYAYIDAGKYNVRVKAVAEVGSDYYDSRFSQDIEVTRLSAPKPDGNNYIVSKDNDLSSGFTVKYQAVQGAYGYQLYKDGALLDGKFATTLQISDNDVADDSVTAEQNYTYIVRSMGGVKVTNGKTTVALSSLTSESLSFNITVLPMPTSLTMSGYNASWSAVNGNNGYAVKYGGNAFTATQTTYDLSTLNAGSYDVSVCTKGNGGATLPSNYTAPVVVERLRYPTGIKISYGAGDGQLGFDPVANATSYDVYLDLSTQALPENAFDNMYQYIREDGTVLSMVAVANKYNDLGTIYYMTSQPSPTQQFIRLSAPVFPEGAFANSTEIVWNASANINTAEYTPTYEVWLDNIAQTGGEQNGTRFNIEYLAGGSTYTFKIKAKGNDTKYLDSEFSVDIDIYKLATPQLKIENNQYTWSGVTNASSYVLEIDGKRVENDAHVSGSKYYYTPNYTTIGNHTVKLYAVGDGGYNTINSATYTYTQKVEQLLAPEIKYSYSNAYFVNGGSIIVEVTKESENNSGYLYEIAGESFSSSNTSASKPIESTGTYSVRAKALGGKIDANEIYYIDSQFAGGGTGYQMILLAAPTVASFSLNSDGAVKWAVISGSYGYDYQISYDGSEYSEIQHTGTASLDPIDNFKSYRTIKFKVRASGDGSSSITSEWVEYTWTNPNA